MKKINILYWVSNGLFALVMLGSSVSSILMDPSAFEGFKFMGLPGFLVPFLGWAKLLGVIAILVPGFPRIKEWAYAGLTFDLIGATYTLYSIGMPFSQVAFMFLFLALAAIAYITYHKRLKAKANRIALQSRIQEKNNERLVTASMA